MIKVGASIGTNTVLIIQIAVTTAISKNVPAAPRRSDPKSTINIKSNAIPYWSANTAIRNGLRLTTTITKSFVAKIQSPRPWGENILALPTHRIPQTINPAIQMDITHWRSKSTENSRIHLLTISNSKNHRKQKQSVNLFFITSPADSIDFHNLPQKKTKQKDFGEIFMNSSTQSLLSSMLASIKLI